MRDLYGILKVSPEAGDMEIKKAYVNMVRNYPPEKAPEEFKEIRKAYETLTNPVARKEYDAFLKHGKEIKRYNEAGMKALENQNFKKAINEFSKILAIEPKLISAKNYLGVAFLYDRQYEKALLQFQELVELEPKNAEFQENLGEAYKNTSQYDKAEEHFLNAYEIDPLNDNRVFEIIAFYKDNKMYDKASSFLKKSIIRNKSSQFDILPYYIELIKIYVTDKNKDEIKNTMDMIERNISNDKKSRDYMSTKLGEIIYKLYDDKEYELVEIIAKRTLWLNPNDSKIKDIYNKSKNKNQAMQKKAAKSSRVSKVGWIPIIISSIIGLILIFALIIFIVGYN